MSCAHDRNREAQLGRQRCEAPDEEAEETAVRHRVSVVVITCNEERLIRPCLDSLLALDYPSDFYEILVVDSSCDRTPRIAAGYPGVRVIRSQPGFSTQRNVGWASARHSIVAHVDADGTVPPGWLQRVDTDLHDPTIAGLTGDSFPPPGTRGFPLWVACVGHPGGGAVGLDANFRHPSREAEFIPCCHGVYRRRALQEMGGFDPQFDRGGEDVELSHRMRRRGYRLHYDPCLCLYHRPRRHLREYLRWNLGVGVSKYNLRRPSVRRLLIHPSSPLWWVPVGAGLVYLAGFPLLLGLALGLLWLGLLGVCLRFARPFPLLLRRRHRIGVGLGLVLTVVPGLIYLRQV